MDRLFCDCLSRNVAFKCLIFIPEISNWMVFVNGKRPRSALFGGQTKTSTEENAMKAISDLKQQTPYKTNESLNN